MSPEPSVALTPDALDPTIGKAYVQIGAPEPNCASLTITSNDHDYTLSGGVLTIIDLYVKTITPGDCDGDLSATIDSSGNLVVDATLNPVYDSNICYISGTLN